MSSKKKKRSCPLSSAKGRPKMAKNTFDKTWAAKLAESDKGSIYNQEKVPDKLDNDSRLTVESSLSAMGCADWFIQKHFCELQK